MPNSKNIEQMALLTEMFGRAKSTIVVDYAGLNVKLQTKLRKSLHEAGGELIIAKNTLLAKTFGKEELKKSLQGQSAVLFSFEDEVAPLKVLVQFAKENNLPQIKQGLLSGKVLTETQVIELSKLPGREELVSQLLSRLNAPASKLVGVLNAGVRDLVLALGAITRKV
ncbi:MAG TPA: 50S ribosomal protein L10 [Patescibacteria group bacterium]|nr:50S ribosomal protein L10 [Patescibacteria group bacterium]